MALRLGGSFVRTVCIDQGGFRSAELQVLVATPDVRFVVTDAALMEMCKRIETWERSVEMKFEYLANVPDRVVFVPGNGENMTGERAARRPHTLGSLIDHETTIWLRALLSEIAAGRKGPAFQKMTDHIHEANQLAQEHHFDHEDNRRRMLGLIETFLGKQGYTEEFRQRLRAKLVGESEYVASVSNAAAMVLHGVSTPWPPELMHKLLDARSYSMRWLWLRVEAVTHWLAEGGSDHAKATSLTNDEIDSQYVIVGSYCDELLTKDNRARQKDARLRAAVTQEAPWVRHFL